MERWVRVTNRINIIPSTALGTNRGKVRHGWIASPHYVSSSASPHKLERLEAARVVAFFLLFFLSSTLDTLSFSGIKSFESPHLILHLPTVVSNKKNNSTTSGVCWNGNVLIHWHNPCCKSVWNIIWRWMQPVKIHFDDDSNATFRQVFLNNSITEKCCRRVMTEGTKRDPFLKKGKLENKNKTKKNPTNKSGKRRTNALAYKHPPRHLLCWCLSVIINDWLSFNQFWLWARLNRTFQSMVLMSRVELH